MSSPELDLLLKEIGEQPDVVTPLLAQQAGAVRAVAEKIRRHAPTAFVLDDAFRLRRSCVSGDIVLNAP